MTTDQPDDTADGTDDADAVVVDPGDRSVEEPSGPDIDVMAWVRLYARQLGVAADVYLAVVGASLVALAVVVLLDGFGFVSAGLTGTTGALLGSGLVLAVVGLFALGVASEGPITSPSIDWPEVQLAIARAVGIIVVSVVALIVAPLLAEPAAGVAYPFELGVVVLEVVARAGLVFALPVGVGGAWVLRARRPDLGQWDRLVILAAWIVGAWLVLAATL